jgi:hypothetical protein
MADINGLIFYEGPGSFTGLRIGASFINAVAAGLGLPVVPTTGDNWVLDGEKDLLKNTRFIINKTMKYLFGIKFEIEVCHSICIHYNISICCNIIINEIYNW